MKQYVWVIIMSLLLSSCGEKRKSKKTFRSYSIPTQIDQQLSGEVVLESDRIGNFYDIAITDDYYVFLGYYSDTLVHVYTKKDLSPYLVGLRESKRPTFEFPSFIKYNYENKGEKNVIDVWDNDMRNIKHYQLNDASSAPYLVTSAKPFTEKFRASNSCSITRDEIYGVAFSPSRPATYYSFNEKAGYYHVVPYPVIPGFTSTETNRTLYSGSICVNEEKGVIVAALRFVNSVNFYNLNCDIIEAPAFGESYIYPVESYKNEFDIQKSTKCFIDVASTDKYVYCLYDGTADYSANSTIVIFDWDGNHIKNLKADRNLRKIAVDKKDKNILSIATNKTGEREVVMYPL